jgi:hypothetical protein
MVQAAARVEEIVLFKNLPGIKILRIPVKIDIWP